MLGLNQLRGNNMPSHYKDDQAARNWGERLVKSIQDKIAGKKDPKPRSAEDLVKKLRKRKRP